MNELSKNKRGKFHDWLTENGLLRIESWASDGLTNTDIAKNIGIARGTLNVWLNKYPDIQDALKKGREPVVRKLENAIVNKALGFEYEESETWVEENEDGERKQKFRKQKKYAEPDTSALIFLLKNYKPNKYRNYNDLTKRQIEAETMKLEREAELAEKELQIIDEGIEREILIVDDIRESMLNADEIEAHNSDDEENEEGGDYIV